MAECRFMLPQVWSVVEPRREPAPPGPPTVAFGFAMTSPFSGPRQVSPDLPDAADQVLAPDPAARCRLPDRSRSRERAACGPGPPLQARSRSVSRGGRSDRGNYIAKAAVDGLSAGTRYFHRPEYGPTGDTRLVATPAVEPHRSGAVGAGRVVDTVTESGDTILSRGPGEVRSRAVVMRFRRRA